ncbi:MAG TPA: alpha/beta fold hydrolase [Candidatus Polarisedimenticolaceae bacterium]|nr:alpha/beta fold hydrolase [Candidatus Polarisedimenticolaceae bacterium]
MDRAAHASRQAALIAVLALAGCVPPPTRIPMASISVAAPVPTRTLVVFLPGRGSDAETFVKHGFADPRVDVVFADATEGYYFDGTVVARLHDDVIAKAGAHGDDRVWLVGVSLGGLGAILYAREHPGDVAGIVLLAPYLGDDTLRREIESAGGLRSWNGDDARGGLDGAIRGAWGWLRDTRTPIWLGYGRSDRLRRSHALLAAALPAERVATVDGGHVWAAWKALWAQLLAKGAAD